MVRGAWGLKAGFCRAGTDWGRGGGEGKVMCACVRAGGGIVCVWGGHQSRQVYIYIYIYIYTFPS